jgi:AcrB/AcrD/AcrF family
MSRFAIKTPLPDRRSLPYNRSRGRRQCRANAGGSLPCHEHSGSRRRHVLSGHAAGADRRQLTYHLERFFTLASGIDHMESRSLSGVSLIKVYFQPGTNADSAVTSIASLAMAEISHLPPGTLPPFVLKMDSSSLPVCRATLKGGGLSETQLKDNCAKRNPQPDGWRLRCRYHPTLRGPVATNHAVRRSVQTRIATVELDGCRARHGGLQRGPTPLAMCRSAALIIRSTPTTR